MNGNLSKHVYTERRVPVLMIWPKKARVELWHSEPYIAAWRNSEPRIKASGAAVSWVVSIYGKSLATPTGSHESEAKLNINKGRCISSHWLHWHWYGAQCCGQLSSVLIPFIVSLGANVNVVTYPSDSAVVESCRCKFIQWEPVYPDGLPGSHHGFMWTQSWTEMALIGAIEVCRGEKGVQLRTCFHTLLHYTSDSLAEKLRHCYTQRATADAER